MKRVVLFVMAAAAATALVLGCAKGYESERTAEGLKITLKAERYPLIKGDNTLAVKVADATGRTVADATVNVRYFMPPMSGMAPMDYTVLAAAKDGAYAVTANIPMEGGWKVEVSVAQPGKPAVTTTFNLDAR